MSIATSTFQAVSQAEGSPELKVAAIVGALMVDSARETADIQGWLTLRLVEEAFRAGASLGRKLGVKEHALEMQSVLMLQGDGGEFDPEGKIERAALLFIAAHPEYFPKAVIADAMEEAGKYAIDSADRYDAYREV